MAELLLPEIILFLAGIIVLVDSRAIKFIAPGGFLFAFVAATIGYRSDVNILFDRSLLVDPVTQTTKLILLFTGFIQALQTVHSREVRSSEQAEMFSLTLFGTVALCFFVSSLHLLVSVVSFEAAVVVSIVLAAFRRRSIASSEAGIKSFAVSAVSAIVFIFGVIILFSLGKSFNVLDIHNEISTAGTDMVVVWLAFGLIFIGLASRATVFPFHASFPDFIQGAPFPGISYIGLSLNIAFLGVLARFCLQVFSSRTDSAWRPIAFFGWPTLLALAAALTMTVGNLGALFQANLKRRQAYAIIAQIGFLLLGLVVGTEESVSATLFGTVTFVFMALGALFVLQQVADGTRSEEVKSLRGLVWRHPFEAVALCVFLLGLAGMPPLSGFVGKIYLLGAVVKAKLYWLAIVAVFNWVIGLTYFLQMVRQVFFAKSGSDLTSLEQIETSYVTKGTLALLLFPTIFLGVYWDLLMRHIIRAFDTVQW